MRKTSFIINHKYFLLGVAFLLPISARAAIFLNILWIILSLFSPQIQNPFNTKFRNWLLVSAAFIIWQLIGFTITDDIHNGIFNLQQKIALLFIPLCLATVNRNYMPKLNEFTIAFSLGLTYYSISHIILASKNVHLTNSLSYFSYTRFSPDFHPSYASAYLCLGVLLLISQLNDSKRKLHTLLISIGIIFFSNVIFILQSKAGITSSFLVILLLFIYLIINKLIPPPIAIFTLSIITISLFLTHTFVLTKNSDRIIQAIDNIEIDKKDEAMNKESSAVRINIWKTAFEKSISTILFGTGSGDVNNDLKIAYLEKGHHFEAEKKFNTHNQYFQILLSGGIVNLILFLFWIYLPLKIAYNSKNMVCLLFILMMAIHFLTESMFESHLGINFFPFMISMLLLVNPNTLINE